MTRVDMATARTALARAILTTSQGMGVIAVFTLMRLDTDFFLPIGAAGNTRMQCHTTSFLCFGAIETRPPFHTSLIATYLLQFYASDIGPQTI